MEQAKAEMIKARKDFDFYPYKNKNGSTGGQNARMGYISKDGLKVNNGYPCHNPIRQYRNAIALWSCNAWRCSKEAAEAYFNWLITSSPWAKLGIVPTNLSKEFMWEEGYVWTNLDKVSAQLLHNFLIATRMPAEWPGYIDAWYKLVNEAGINHELAFAMLTVFIPVNTDTSYLMSPLDDKAESAIAIMNKYDWPLDMASASEEYLMNFINAKTPGFNPKPFYPTAETQPINLIWGKPLDFKSDKLYGKKIYQLYSKKLGSARTADKQEYGLRSGKISSEDQLIFTPKAVIEIVKREEARLNINSLKKAA